MIIEQSDLFKGLSSEIINEIAENMAEEVYSKGAFVIKEKHPAEHFYILREGRIRLSVGEKSRITHSLCKPGQTFGW